jgi:hypothetical protein
VEVLMTRDQLEADIRALDALVSSRAWAVITQAISEDITRAAMDLGSDPRMPESEVHFRRGAICAASGFLSVVNRLRVKLENDALLAGGSFGPLNNPDATAQGDF